MKIKILGTRGEIKISSPDHKKHAGILIDKKILIDCGEEKYLNYDPKIILITHLHPDHAFFISEKKIIDLNVPVYAPEEFPELKTIKSFKDKLFFSEYGY